MLYDTLTLTQEGDYSKPITSCREAIDFISNELAKLGASLDQEASYILNLDRHGKPLRCRILSLGTQGQVYINPVEIFKTALRDNATSIMIFHNHPCNSLNPSLDDIIMTRKIVEAGYLIGIPLADHILTNNNYPVTGELFSFREKKMISLDEYIQKYEGNNISIDDIDFNRKGANRCSHIR